MIVSVVRQTVLAALVAVLTLSCGGTQITKSSIDRNRVGKPVSDILVIVVADKPENRATFERKFVEHLQAAGVEAVSSTEAIPMPPDLKLEKDVILKAVAKYETDAVIVTFLAGIEEKDTNVNTGRVYQGYYDYYGFAYGYVNDTGFYRGVTTVKLRTNLYDVKTEKLIWSGESKSTDVGSVGQLTNEVIPLVVAELQKNNLIAPKKQS
jgi:hypothetical protein